MARCQAKEKFIRSGVPYICNICNIGGEWLGKKLTLELDHINGNNSDDNFSNLRLLCPNCHSQQPTTNRKKSRSGSQETYVKKITPDRVIDLAKSGRNIRQILFALECSDTGFNYKTIRKILKVHGVEIQSKAKIVFSFDGRTIGGPRIWSRKTTWPSKLELQRLVDSESAIKIGKRFNVSGTMVKKWCRLYGIESKPRGYWAKIHSQQLLLSRSLTDKALVS